MLMMLRELGSFGLRHPIELVIPISWRSVLFGILTLVLIAGHADETRAQCGISLHLEPTCGDGTNVNISGKNWPKGSKCGGEGGEHDPSSTCEYRYFWKGAEVRAAGLCDRQGIIGEPSCRYPDDTSLVPNVATVPVEARVEAWKPGYLEKKPTLCYKTKYCRVDREEYDPWRGAGAGHPHSTDSRFNSVWFDPTKICSLPNCDRIKLVQAVRVSVVTYEGGGQNLLPTETGISESSYKLPITTPAFFHLDVLSGKGVPFYNDNTRNDQGRTESELENTNGFHRENCEDKVAQLADRPRLVKSRTNTNWKSYVFTFVVRAYCTAGPASGGWYGPQLVWYAVQNFGPNGKPEPSTSFPRTPPEGTPPVPANAIEDAFDKWLTTPLAPEPTDETDRCPKGGTKC